MYSESIGKFFDQRISTRPIVSGDKIKARREGGYPRRARIIAIIVLLESL
jgi:hypothetical protein